MRTNVRRSIIRSAILLGAVGVGAIAASQVGCSASPGTTGSELGGGEENGGSVGMHLTLPGGEQVNTVNWTITGPNGASTVVQSGSVNVASSSSIQFLVGGIPAATNYSIALSAVTIDGLVTCTGSATFNTVARMTTNVSVTLQCNSPTPDSGAALITATTFNCATVTAMSAVPAEVIAGNPVTVSAAATGPNLGAVTYQWSAPSGTFGSPNSAVTSYTCAAGAGASVNLTVTASDGAIPDGGACPSATSTVTVTCDGHVDAAQAFATATKVKHLIVIFDENISYDHYFATYPSAQNNAGETAFTSAPGTPVSNNLVHPLDPTHGFAPNGSLPNLLTNNPNFTNSANGAGAANPFRLSATTAITADQGHNYKPEQQASDNGLMDLFPASVGTHGPPPTADSGAPAAAQTTGLVMAYYDGNALPVFWGLAQQYAMSDNSWTTSFGPSTPGAVNLISGQTNGIATGNKAFSSMGATHVQPDGNGGWTLIGDTGPLGDVCTPGYNGFGYGDQTTMAGPNVGTMLNGVNVTWGWFQGGFNLGLTNSGNSSTGCSRSTAQTAPYNQLEAPNYDYIPHHNPFQYYAATQNLTHARPFATSTIGYSTYSADGGTQPEPANHQYDSQDFFTTLSAGNLPAVTYLKAPAFQDGHPGYSNPTDEQTWVNSIVSAVQGSQEWASTVIVVAYDDSDGWYDHQAPPIVNTSNISGIDVLNGASGCVSGAQQGPALSTPLLGVAPADGGAPAPAQGRCGYGTRVPLMVISPFAKRNYIDHTLTDQTSILKFVEDNWLGGQRVQPGGSFDTIAGSIQNMLTGI
jgi:phospholipase C